MGLECDVIITSSVLIHIPLVIVQRKVAEAPTVKPVMPEVLEVGVVIVAAPATMVHNPELLAPGALPARVAVVRLQISWSGPALEVVGKVATVIITSSVIVAQGAPETVHLKVDEAPAVNPVTPEVGEAGVVIAPVPAILVHVPEPGLVGVLPASVAVVAQTVWSGPASEVSTA